MNLLQKLKQQTLAQTVGGLLILISGLLVLIKISGIVPDFDLVENKCSFHDNWPFIFLIGAFLYCSPKILKKLKKLRGKPVSPFLVLCGLFLTTPIVSAQDYTKQVGALAESFNTKSIESVNEYLSADLQFGPIPAANSPVILTNMVTNLPRLIALEILESKDKEAIVKYKFVRLGENESSIMFNEDGKITKIEYLEEIVMEQIRAQQRLQSSIQQPSPGELGESYSPEIIQFKSLDGLQITGNLYEVDTDAPIILLGHSGNSNKYEYADIAPKLNARGYNALAIDQRSGGTFAEHQNETFQRAAAKGLGTDFVDAQQDIEAAINFLANKYGKKITLWGSSYSAALSLFIAQDNENLNGLILFSPGDYLSEVKGSLKGTLTSIDIPFLITSTKDEAEEITNVLLYEVELSESQNQHIPLSEGFHGVRALWENQAGSEEYWDEVWETLSAIYPAE